MHSEIFRHSGVVSVIHCVYYTVLQTGSSTYTLTMPSVFLISLSENVCVRARVLGDVHIYTFPTVFSKRHLC